MWHMELVARVWCTRVQKHAVYEQPACATNLATPPHRAPALTAATVAKYLVGCSALRQKCPPRGFTGQQSKSLSVTAWSVAGGHLAFADFLDGNLLRVLPRRTMALIPGWFAHLSVNYCTTCLSGIPIRVSIRYVLTRPTPNLLMVSSGGMRCGYTIHNALALQRWSVKVYDMFLTNVYRSWQQKPGLLIYLVLDW